MKYTVQISRFTARFLAICMVLSMLVAGLPTAFATSDTGGDGSFTFTMPASCDPQQVTVTLYHYYNGTLVYNGETTPTYAYSASQAGTVTDTGSAVFTNNWHRVQDDASPGGYNNLYLGHSYTFSNVTQGTTITINGIPSWYLPSDDSVSWKSYDTVTATVAVTDSPSIFIFEETEPVTITAGQTASFGTATIHNTAPLQSTNNTFSGTGGSYAIEYFLTNFNAVSLEEIEGTHIVGPILALEHAARSGFSYQSSTNGLANGSSLVAADLSHGISSYIGKLVADPVAPDIPAAKLGYAFDLDLYPSFTYPTLYANHTHQQIFFKGLYGDNIEHVAQYDPTSALYLAVFNSPNAGGIGVGGQITQILQNSNYINKSSLASTLYDASANLLAEGVIPGEDSRAGDIITKPSDDTVSLASYGDVLEIKLGESYQITQGSTSVSTINIITTHIDGYNYATVTDPITTINLDKSALAVINGLAGQSGDHYIFPKILVDGAELAAGQGDGSGFSDGGEYNLDKFTRVIWNLHDLTETLSFNNSINIPGHIIAPYADIRHYVGTSTTAYWGGGNLNGTMIANSIQCGVMELHLWPYGPTSGAPTTSLSLEGTKELDNPDLVAAPSLTDFIYQIALDSTSVVGYTYDTTTVNGASDGTIQFDFGTYNEIGTYTYLITEIEGDPLVDPDYSLNYDMSQFKVVVTVSDLSASPSYTITKTKSADGGDLSDSVSSILFENIVVDLTSAVPITLQGTKSMSPSTYPLGEYSFKISLVAGNSSDVLYDSTAVVKNSGDGTFQFDLSFLSDGDYQFQIIEQPDQSPDSMNLITYDTAVYTVTINVASGVATITELLKDSTSLDPSITLDFVNVVTTLTFPDTGGAGIAPNISIGIALLSLGFACYHMKKKVGY